MLYAVYQVDLAVHIVKLLHGHFAHLYQWINNCIHRFVDVKRWHVFSIRRVARQRRIVG